MQCYINKYSNSMDLILHGLQTVFAEESNVDSTIKLKIWRDKVFLSENRGGNLEHNRRRNKNAKSTHDDPIDIQGIAVLLERKPAIK